MTPGRQGIQIKPAPRTCFRPDGKRLQDMRATPDTAASNDSPGPSLFTALQEQLGLRVESEKGAVQQFVIDAVEKPSEN